MFSLFAKHSYGLLNRSMEMDVLTRLTDSYWEFQEREKDERCGHYPLMHDPTVSIGILITYLLAVYAGPKIMAKRKPFMLTTYTKIYNLAQIIFCVYMVSALIYLTEYGNEGLPMQCKPFDRSNSPKMKKLAFLVYLNYACRLIELSETMVHILRKKNNQLSFLHVYHHAFNFYLAWITAKFLPGGVTSVIILLNFSVHLVMYSYYYLSTHSNKTIANIARRVKRYITMIQLVQFIYMLMVASQTLYVPFCQTPPLLLYSFVFHVTMNLFLFSNFYRKTFMTKGKKTE